MGLFKRARKAWKKSWAETNAKVERQKLMAERKSAAHTPFTRQGRYFDAQGLFAYTDEIAAASLREDARVSLLREPTNKWDRNAIALVGPAGSKRWGYMPADLAKQYAGPIDRGARFTVTIAGLSVYDGEVTDVYLLIEPVI